jgi:hypothetical protein
MIHKDRPLAAEPAAGRRQGDRAWTGPAATQAQGRRVRSNDEHT